MQQQQTGDGAPQKEPTAKEQRFKKIRDRILKTISEYEDMLEIAEDEAQQSIVRATLKTLHKQLKEVEIMEKRKN